MCFDLILFPLVKQWHILQTAHHILGVCAGSFADEVVYGVIGVHEQVGVVKRSLAHLTTMTKARLNFLCGLHFTVVLGLYVTFT